MAARRVVIVGAGPGGYTAALRASKLGADVTLIEQSAVGGTCLNEGCIPSKFLKTSAEALERMKRPESLGLRLDGQIVPDMAEMMSRKRAVIRAQIDGMRKLLKKAGVRFLSGRATISDLHRASVILNDGETCEVPWDRLILATGSVPLELPEFPFDSESVLSSSDALELRSVPESIAVIGGGAIGCEFAFILNALGSEVTVVEALPRILPLPAVDEDTAKTLQREMKKRRIRFIVNHQLADADKAGGSVVATLAPSPSASDVRKSEREPSQLTVEKLLICVGRQPQDSCSGADAVVMDTDANGWVTVNDRMETSVPDVYAVGDMLGPAKVMLAHVAAAEGIVAAEHAVGTGPGSVMNYDAVPGAIYTMPEVAYVGKTLAQAEAEGVVARADTVLFRNLGMAQAMGEIAGQTRMVSEIASGRVLGVQIIGPHATDLIAEAVLAIRMGCTVREVSDTIHAHPTLSEALAEAAMKSQDVMPQA